MLPVGAQCPVGRFPAAGFELDDAPGSWARIRTTTNPNDQRLFHAMCLFTTFDPPRVIFLSSSGCSDAAHTEPLRRLEGDYCPDRPECKERRYFLTRAAFSPARAPHREEMPPGAALRPPRHSRRAVLQAEWQAGAILEPVSHHQEDSRELEGTPVTGIRGRKGGARRPMDGPVLRHWPPPGAAITAPVRRYRDRICRPSQEES